jgi:hypothetical protein
MFTNSVKTGRGDSNIFKAIGVDPHVYISDTYIGTGDRGGSRIWD